MSAPEFGQLVAAIYLADCLFHVTELLVAAALRRRAPRRDPRGRFARARAI